MTRNKQDKEQRQKEYRELLIELYKENQKFLSNLILGISSLAFPFLFDVLSTDKLTKISQFFLSIALYGFCFVIVLQIISVTTAREGCDNALSKDKGIVENANSLFKKAKKFDEYRNLFFVFSFFSTAVGLTLSFNRIINSLINLML